MTGKIIDGGPAFPFTSNDISNVKMQAQGMSKREYYAAMALQGINAGYWSNPEMSGLSPRDRADEAVQSADALIAALAARVRP